MKPRISVVMTPARIDALLVALSEYIEDFNGEMDSEDRRLLTVLQRLVDRLEKARP